MLPDSLKLIRQADRQQLQDPAWLADTIAQLGLERPTVAQQGSPDSFGGLLTSQTPIQFAPYLIHLATLGLRSYVEMGAYHGGSLIITVEYLSRFAPVEHVGVIDMHVLPPVREYIQSRGGTVIEARTDTPAAERYLRETRPDLVLVDADHSEECCRHDYRLARRFARYVALHDITEWTCPGAGRVWQTISEPTREFVAQYDPTTWTIHGLGLAGPFNRKDQIVPKYQVTGIPLSPSPVSGRKHGDVVELDLSPEDEKAWTGAGAIRKLKAEPKKDDQRAAAADKQDS